MYTEKQLKEKLIEIYNADPYVHMNVSLAKPHVELKNVRVKLVGVYRHIFQVEEDKNGKIERFSFQYGDLLSGIVKIAEI